MNDKNLFCARYGNAEYITRLLKDPNPSMTYREAGAMLNNPCFSTKHIDMGIKHPDANVRGTMPWSHQIETRHLDELINDSSVYVREQVARSKKVTKEHLTKLISDPSFHVRTAALDKMSDLELKRKE